MPENALQKFAGTNLSWMNPFRGGVGGFVQDAIHAAREIEQGKSVENLLQESLAQILDETLSGTAAAKANSDKLNQIQPNTNRLPDIQTTVNSIAAADPAAIADAVWGFTNSDGYGDYTINAVGSSSVFAWRVGNMAAFRTSYAINFLTCFTIGIDGNPPQVLPNLNGANPQAKLSGETDLEMLQRVYPAYDWVANYQGSQYCGTDLVPDSSFVPFQVFYVPPPPSLAEIHALWDYTPSSGPPMRNGIDDSMAIWSMLPIQY